MNVKRIAALCILGALISTVGPTMAATGTITVKWNTQNSASLQLNTQTTASLTHTAPAANDIFWNGAATSQCNGVSAASKDPGVNSTVNFGNVTPDGTLYTNCLEVNAIETYVLTNDAAGFTMTAAVTGTPVGYDTAANGTLLCDIPSPAGGWNAAGSTAWSASARVAAIAMVSTTACSSGTAVTSVAATELNETAAVAVAADLNHDLQLNLGPNATTGVTSATVTYTVTPN